LLPIPEFIIYQDLADELDEITAKIRRIVETIDVKGLYDASVPNLEQMFESATRLFPVDNWRHLTEKGGINGVVDFADISPQVQAFIALIQQRDALLNTIYQTIGISDIARGQSDPRETATAQRLKGNFGNLRLGPRQRGLQRYLRDIMRIQGEVIAEKFEPTTLELMTGQEIDEQVLQLLRVNALRDFAVDIETDSTIAADQQQVQQDLKEMFEGLAAFANAAQALPEGARLPMLQSVTRKLKLGRDIEVALEEAANEPPKPDPAAIEAQQKAQTEQGKLEIENKKADQKFTIDQANVALDAQELALKQDEAEAKIITTAFGGGNAS
jgi:hypothetical protein